MTEEMVQTHLSARLAHQPRGAPLQPGDPRELGGYQLLAVLGEGGMGRVYLGRAADGQLVAVKAIRVDIAHDDAIRERFRREVSRTREVPASSTAAVITADPDHDPPYLVVEYVDGASLAEAVATDGPLTAASLHWVAIGVAVALRAIHEAGVIHRDLNPSNVLLAQGLPKVIDFGIARPVDSSTQPGESEAEFGSIPYMAPERFYPKERPHLTTAVDIFAWGAVVTFAGTGRSPFAANSIGATVWRILHGTPDIAGLARPLRDLVERALANDVSIRPTAQDLVERLTADGPSVAATTRGARRRRWFPVYERRRRQRDQEREGRS
jgi:eukaryotic-like serine/threonine-protein kinase